MAVLTEAQIRVVAERLDKFELSYMPLKEELLDHVCCAVERGMSDGAAFPQALEQAFGAFREDEMQKVEQQTIAFLNQKSIIMKRVALLTLAVLLVTSTLVWSSQSEPPSISPIEGNFKISSSFGMRMHPIYKKMKMHKGMDIKAKLGTPVRSTSAGVVVKVVQSNSGYGNHIIIRHDEQYESVYAQLTEDLEVTEGQQVKRGQLIGYVGSSGASTAPHLHYEVIKNGEHQDPAGYIGL